MPIGRALFALSLLALTVGACTAISKIDNTTPTSVSATSMPSIETPDPTSTFTSTIQPQVSPTNTQSPAAIPTEPTATSYPYEGDYPNIGGQMEEFFRQYLEIMDFAPHIDALGGRHKIILFDNEPWCLTNFWAAFRDGGVPELNFTGGGIVFVGVPMVNAGSSITITREQRLKLEEQGYQIHLIFETDENPTGKKNLTNKDFKVPGETYEGNPPVVDSIVFGLSPKELVEIMKTSRGITMFAVRRVKSFTIPMNRITGMVIVTKDPKAQAQFFIDNGLVRNGPLESYTIDLTEDGNIGMRPTFVGELP